MDRVSNLQDSENTGKGIALVDKNVTHTLRWFWPILRVLSTGLGNALTIEAAEVVILNHLLFSIASAFRAGRLVRIVIELKK